MRRKHRSRKGEKTQITPCDDFETSRCFGETPTVLSLDRKLISWYNYVRWYGSCRI